MTPEELDLIASSASVIVTEPDLFATAFYDRLFEVGPETRALFHDDLTEQRGKLVDELAFLTGAATDLDAFVGRARDLGRRHVGYGVRPEHYEMVETALLEGLRVASGTRWNDAVDQAWRRLYRLIAETMLDGASEELFTP